MRTSPALHKRDTSTPVSGVARNGVLLELMFGLGLTRLPHFEATSKHLVAVVSLSAFLKMPIIEDGLLISPLASGRWVSKPGHPLSNANHMSDG